jgi:NADPH:quinone reductase-like Zn-dependent oxidoreductase
MAAAMNPVMSSWMALRHRIDFRRNQSVLVLGATGNAGRIAIQVAKRFGASKVIAAGRDQTRLESLGALGADETCTFEQLAAAAEVDVVLDYVWGKPAVQAIIDMLTARIDRSRNLTWIQIGSIAGPDAPIPSAALRQARLQIVGSGIGSVPGPDFIEEIPNIAAAVTGGAFDVRPRAVPLADVERTWTEALHSFDRIVLIP